MSRSNVKRYPILLRRVYEIEAGHDGNLNLNTLTPAFCQDVMREDAVLLLQREGLIGLVPRETFENVWCVYYRWIVAMPNRDKMPPSTGIIGWDQTIPIHPRILSALRLKGHKDLGHKAPDTTDAEG